MVIETIGKPLEIAHERLLTIKVNERDYNLSCTPSNLESLVLGFLFTSGVISSLEELVKFELDESRMIASVEIKKLKAKKDGISKVSAKERYDVEELRTSLAHLEIEEYKRTRGYHVACVINKNGLIERSYDVGRHNAVDKVVGKCLKRNIDFSKVFLLISGRISRDMVLKCINAGIPLIVSKAAIFDSAIDLCMKTGLSAVSFATNLVVKGEAIK